MRERGGERRPAEGERQANEIKGEKKSEAKAGVAGIHGAFYIYAEDTTKDGTSVGSFSNPSLVVVGGLSI